MDGDGKAEVVTRLQIGDEVFLAILNGMTGEVLRKTPWPPMATDFCQVVDADSPFDRLSRRQAPGRRHADRPVRERGDSRPSTPTLSRLWQFDSFKETNGSGGHKIEVGRRGRRRPPGGLRRHDLPELGRHAALVDLQDASGHRLGPRSSARSPRPGGVLRRRIRIRTRAPTWSTRPRARSSGKSNRDDDPRLVARPPRLVGRHLGRLAGHGMRLQPGRPRRRQPAAVQPPTGGR